jgi:hypothetical protein
MYLDRRLVRGVLVAVLDAVLVANVVINWGKFTVPTLPIQQNRFSIEKALFSYSKVAELRALCNR